MKTLVSKVFTAALVSLGFVSMYGCGGGGGGGSDFVGAAKVSLELAPQVIDTGDRTKVSIDISEVHENGILLKVRYPDGLSYVAESALIEIDGAMHDTGPSFNGIIDDDVYLVFFLSGDLFKSEKTGVLTLELVGEISVKGELEIDADVDDPMIDNSVEFETDNPEFSAEDGVAVEVAE